MKMERMKMSFYQNNIEVFLVFFKHTKKKYVAVALSSLF